MPGRVLKSGCVQVVQNLRIIPDVLHPRCRLTDAVTDYIGEAVYVPVFCTSRPHLGPVAVLEAVLSAHATDAMLVANFISIAGTALSAMQVRQPAQAVSNVILEHCWIVMMSTS